MMFTRTEQDNALAALTGGSYTPDVYAQCNHTELFVRANTITFTLIAPFKDGKGYLLKIRKDTQAQLEATELVCRKPELRRMLRKSRF